MLTTTGSWEALVVSSDSEASTWDFQWRYAEKVLLPYPMTLIVVELVENQPAMGPFCLDMSMTLSEAILMPGLFSYQTQWFSVETILSTKGHLPVPGNTFSCHTGEVVLLDWVESREASKHPKMYGIVPTPLKQRIVWPQMPRVVRFRRLSEPINLPCSSRQLELGFPHSEPRVPTTRVVQNFDSWLLSS